MHSQKLTLRSIFLAVLVLAPSAFTPVVGAIVAVDIVPDINVPSSGTFIPLDLNGDGTADVSGSTVLAAGEQTTVLLNLNPAENRRFWRLRRGQ